MTFQDCLCAATIAAADEDIPVWLLPNAIVNQATLLSGCRSDGGDAMGWY